MKKRFKIVSLLLAGVMALSMTGCGGSTTKYNIGICQLIQHTA